MIILNIILIEMIARHSLDTLANVFTNYPNVIDQSMQGNPRQSERMIEKQPLQCKYCQYIGPRLTRLQHHVKIKHQGLRLRRKECKFQFTDGSNLQKHIDKIHRGICHRCEHWSRIVLGKISLKNNVKNKHTNPNNCPKVKSGE